MNEPTPSPLTTHSERVFTIDHFLAATDCADLIRLADEHGFESAGVRTAEGQRSMPTVRNNERTLFESPQWVQRLWEGLAAAALPSLQGQKALGLPKDLRFYKYSPGQRFKMHKDGPWMEGGLTSRLTFLVYLNENFTGGETDFRDFKIQPRTGRALLFIHDTWHEGATVEQGTKYVLRSDVLYGMAP
ncbi:prolyl hydroxylase family protein [Polaromonas sp. LjRoot131]|uniref:prolyl hydroxylase family protein n=1 Tax=Polaromonas sp. LjRoot131 TaxID=3342262 RepID=UPI003ED047CF